MTCRAWFSVVVLALVVLGARNADAYPWMIRQGYTGCANCHVDPSGEGLLTPYGRAQSVLVLSARYGGPPDQEPGSISKPFFGVSTPDWLALGGWVRDGYLWTTSRGSLVDRRFLQMRAELGAHVTVDRFRAAATLGGAIHSATALTEQAWITHSETGPNVVSRQHWVGVDLGEQRTMLLRAGRINLPFGLRTVEHTAWVRAETRTDVNQAQQHGVALSYSYEPYRAEIMAIAGNFQMSPDRFRDRGYAGYVERALAERLTLGLSSKVTHAERDLTLATPTTRQAHGLFARYAVTKPVVVLAEGDVLVSSPSGLPIQGGSTTWLQVDFEPWQSLHFDVAGETLKRAEPGSLTQYGVWLGVWFFYFTHFDVRVDAVIRGGNDTPTTIVYLAQMNAYL